MQNTQCTMEKALFAALALLAVDIYAQATETGGAAGFAATPSATAQGIRRLDAAWASNNHVRASAYYEDYDNDCLENWAEAALGRSPWTNDVAGVSVAAAKSIGAFDLVPGAWKAVHGLSSPLSWSEDPDNDGWDNWSEWMAGTDPNAATNRPDPRLSVTLDYQAALRGRLVVWVHSREDMNGWPDAVYTRDISITAPPATVELTDADLIHGHIRQGRNWFFAWVGSGSGAPLPAWSPNEPAAIADNQLDGIDIGFDRNEVTFRLVDKVESFARIAWTGRMPADNVHVSMLLGDNEVFTRVIKWPRTWLHEGDVISWNTETFGNSQDFGLGALLSFDPSNDTVARAFEVKLTSQYALNAEQAAVDTYCEVTNWIHTASALAPVVAYATINEAARPVFRFRLDPEYTEFNFTMRKDPDNTRIFSKRILAPGRSYNAATGKRDLVVWRFPHCVGERIVNGGETNLFDFSTQYRWRVAAYSPGNTSLPPQEGSPRYPDWQTFTTPAPESGWCAGIYVVAASAHTTADSADSIRIRAYPIPSCSGFPAGVCQANYATTLANCIRGLPGPGPWYIRADSSLATGFAAHGKRPVPIFAEPGDGPLSITNRIIIRDCK